MNKMLKRTPAVNCQQYRHRLQMHGKFVASSTWKKVELEVLYQDLLNLKSNGEVDISDSLKDQLRAEGTKCRDNSPSILLTKEMKEAAKSLKQNPDIIIRRGDKSSVYVIMDKDDYLSKLEVILSDTSKFQPLTRNPVEVLKNNLNTLIEQANSAAPNTFKKITGDYNPGYLYGNPKTHKDGIPLRPIISQIPTPTYAIAKQLDSLIKPYIPSKYMLKSRDEFIDIIRGKDPTEETCSLDVESLFTNVPVKRTISFILKHVYHHSQIKPPSLPRNILKELLLTCTTSVPFLAPTGKLYLQTDGIAMGSPLGPTFANMYMAVIENNVLSKECIPLELYLRYVDDIFLVCSKSNMEKLCEHFEKASVLTFTYELAKQKKLAFLDVLVETKDETISTSVYHKPTDAGQCLNFNSECPIRYKLSVIKSYIKRAYSVSSSWDLFNAEITRMKQILVNNGFPNSIVDTEIRTVMNNIRNQHQNQNCDKIKVFYCNQMNNNYKTDETVIKNIITKNVVPKKLSTKLDIVIYYKNRKTNQMVMTNNILAKGKRQLDKSRVIYQYSCPYDVCKRHPSINNSYIGFTTMKLTRRLSYHLSSGAIVKHSQQIHSKKVSRDELVENTITRYLIQDCRRLEILESLLIYHEKPELNLQDTGFSRKLHLYC